MLVYSAKHQCLNQFNNIESDQYTLTNDVDLALASTDTKIGIFEFEWIRDNYQDPRLSEFKKVIVICTELWYPWPNDTTPQWFSNTLPFIQAHPEFYFFIPGYDEELTNQSFYPHWLGIAWIYNSTNKYSTLSTMLDLLESGTKPKLFDCLLGTYKPHRSYAYYRLLELGILDQCICSYGRGNDPGVHLGIKKQSPKFIQDLCSRYGEPEVGQWSGPNFGVYNFDNNTLRESSFITDQSAQTTLYQGVNLPISCVLPVEIYNQTAYTIVAETMYNCNFYTEKIVKPILAKRLFIVFAGCGYLRGLQSLGFRTFCDIIDESYDQQTNEETRWNMVAEQIKRLASMDQATVLSAIQDRVEHNQRLLFNTNWQTEPIRQIQRMIASA